MINPLENLDESKIQEIESHVQNFYEIVKNTPASQSDKLLSFVSDFDLEPHLAEEKEIDLISILGLNITDN